MRQVDRPADCGGDFCLAVALTALAWPATTLSNAQSHRFFEFRQELPFCHCFPQLNVLAVQTGPADLWPFRD
jgi:hypothetical protein